MVRQIGHPEYLADPRTRVVVGDNPHLAQAPVQEWLHAKIRDSNLKSREVPGLGTYYDGLRVAVDADLKEMAGHCDRTTCSLTVGMLCITDGRADDAVLSTRCNQGRYGEYDLAEAHEDRCLGFQTALPQRIGSAITEQMAPPADKPELT